MSNNRIDIVGLSIARDYGSGRETLWDGPISGKPASRLIRGCGEDYSKSTWLALVQEGGLTVKSSMEMGGYNSAVVISPLAAI